MLLDTTLLMTTTLRRLEPSGIRFVIEFHFFVCLRCSLVLRVFVLVVVLASGFLVNAINVIIKQVSPLVNREVVAYQLVFLMCSA